MPRFYCQEPITANTRLRLPDPVAHHALRVLRLPDGAAIILFDGLGGEYGARLRLDGKHAYAEVGAHDPTERELAGRLVLLQAISSGERMDLVVEKAVELGVSELYPINARRSAMRLDGERLERRMRRWQAIAQSASAQCGRNLLMRIHAPAGLAEAIEQAGCRVLLCHPQASQDLRQAIAAPDAMGDALALLVGPEGGWSEDELSLAMTRGAVPVRFGTRTMRTETAGIALAAACVALLGWH